MNNNIISLKKSKVFVGMDLSKNFHVVKAIDINGDLIGTMPKLDNHYECFAGFKNWIYDIKTKYNAESVIIGMEPTGIYWQDIASYINDNMDECEAVFVKAHKVGLIRKLYDNGTGKNDYVDALAIARCVKENNYFYIDPQDEEFNNLKALSRHRDDYIKRKSYLFNKLENNIGAVFADYKKVFKDWSSETFVTILCKYPLPEDIVSATEQELLTQLRTRIRTGIGLKKIRHLKAVAEYYIENRNDNAYLAANDVNKLILVDYLTEYLAVIDKIKLIDCELEKITSTISYSEDILQIEGVGNTTVSALLAEAGDINRFATSKQLISYIGLNLRACSSGTHKGKMKISKCGSRKLRNILFKVALPLVSQNNYFKIYYNYLISRKQNPLKKMQALVAVCCKFLRCIHGMIKNNTKFDGMEVIKGINISLVA